MKTLYEILEERQAFLKQQIGHLTSQIAKSPSGFLRISPGRKSSRYYYHENKQDPDERYLKKEEMPFAAAIAQREYHEKLLQVYKSEQKAIEKLLRTKYPDEGAVYSSMVRGRREIVKPLILPDKEYVRNWLSEPYEKKGFDQEAPEYFTDNGERVRSKSELLIANKLLQAGIPYKYECPLYLTGYGLIHPDFTALNVRLREIYYWEHLGLMDKDEYREKALDRITRFEKNGILPGQGLIITHETALHPLSTALLDIMIQNYLI